MLLRRLEMWHRGKWKALGLISRITEWKNKRKANLIHQESDPIWMLRLRMHSPRALLMGAESDFITCSETVLLSRSLLTYWTRHADQRALAQPNLCLCQRCSQGSTAQLHWLPINAQKTKLFSASEPLQSFLNWKDFFHLFHTRHTQTPMPPSGLSGTTFAHCRPLSLA